MSDNAARKIAMNNYRYTNLTAALRDKASPLRQLFDSRFPNTKVVQAQYRAEEPELRVDGGSANPGTLGAAFDFAMRFGIKSQYDPTVARNAFESAPGLVDEIDAVIIAAQMAAGLGDRVTVQRASWAFALLTEVYRAGLQPGSPLVELLEARSFSAQRLLGLASDDALRQLAELDEVARSSLLPRLDGPYVLGPTFDGSALCKADADVIAGGLLLDFKTSIGTKNARTGSRSDRLDLLDLYQIVAYALFDRSDSYAIDRVGIYSARFGHLVSWDLQVLLDTLAGEHTPVENARAEVWMALGGS